MGCVRAKSAASRPRRSAFHSTLASSRGAWKTGGSGLGTDLEVRRTERAPTRLPQRPPSGQDPGLPWPDQRRRHARLVTPYLWPRRSGYPRHLSIRPSGRGQGDVTRSNGVGQVEGSGGPRSCWSWTLNLSRKVDARTALGAIMVIVGLPSRLGYRSGPRGECLRRARPRPPHSRCRMCRPEPTPPRFR
jgi:hypothetical protein